MEAGAMRSTIRPWVTGILLAWIVVFAASFIVPILVPPTGESFFRGLNRIVYWFWLQVAALVLALAACALAHWRRAYVSRSLKLLTLLPVSIAAAVAIFLASIIYWASP